MKLRSVDNCCSSDCNCSLVQSFVERRAGYTERSADCTYVGCKTVSIVAADTAGSRLDSPAGPCRTRSGSFLKAENQSTSVKPLWPTHERDFDSKNDCSRVYSVLQGRFDSVTKSVSTKN